MSVLGTGLALGGLGSALDWGLDMLGGIVGNSMSKDTAKSLLKRQFNYQKDLMKIQNDYNVYNYQHQHQWRVTDLRDAGLNQFCLQQVIRLLLRLVIAVLVCRLLDFRAVIVLGCLVFCVMFCI